jgi:hypothetical protein
MQASRSIDVRLSQRSQLGPAKTCEGGQEYQRPITRPDLLGHRVDLGHSQDRAFRRNLSVSSLDPARVAADQPVIKRGVEDRPQQPVCLSRRDLTRARVQQPLAPATDPRQGDLTNSDALEVRGNVGA